MASIISQHVAQHGAISQRRWLLRGLTNHAYRSRSNQYSALNGNAVYAFSVKNLRGMRLIASSARGRRVSGRRVAVGRARRNNQEA